MFRTSISALCLAATLAPAIEHAHGKEPLKLLPQNPHYFLFRGRATPLVASTEHYGSVLNADFDQRRYLDEIKAAGLNYTRIFTGAMSEHWGEPFNTLNPPRGRLLAPWARSDKPGYADGGSKFDLDRWDDAYFKRLREFVDAAGERGVVVEVTLFTNWYAKEQWGLSPLNARNNVNGVGGIGFERVNTLKNGEVLGRQEAMVRKIVTELNDRDNVFFEVCNEPGADGDWMDRIAEVIWQAEGKLPNRHLIASNEHPVPHVSILNIHYDRDRAFLRRNLGRGIVVGYDETGFDGPGDLAYRRQGWQFLLEGGGLYDNLDWSFSVAHPDGSETKWDKHLGGGSPALRRQLGILLAVVRGLDLAAAKPDKGVVRGEAAKRCSVLAVPGRQYVLYVSGGPKAELTLDLPAGDYRAEWIDTKTGKLSKGEDVSGGGVKALRSPDYSEDIALRITRK